MFHPLYHLSKKDVMWLWGKKPKQAFTEANNCMVCRAPVLAHYNFDAPIKFYCDASTYGVGACLMHVIEGKEKPVVNASLVLTPAETNYPQREREELSIIFGVKRFHQYLAGVNSHFKLTTNHFASYWVHDKECHHWPQPECNNGPSFSVHSRTRSI